MKNLIFLLLFIPVFCLGQDKHMKFRDIELKGNILNFVNELQKLDYSLSSVENEGTTAVLKGKFIGKDCELFVLASSKTKTVWKVSVYFHKSNSWKTLKSDYISLKEQISDKYGKPFKTVETFSPPHQEGDGHELQALKKDKCTYNTFWRTNEGIIKLSITSFCQVAIGYEDRISSDIDLKEKSVKVNKDL